MSAPRPMGAKPSPSPPVKPGTLSADRDVVLAYDKDKATASKNRKLGYLQTDIREAVADLTGFLLTGAASYGSWEDYRQGYPNMLKTLTSELKERDPNVPLKVEAHAGPFGGTILIDKSPPKPGPGPEDGAASSKGR